MMKVWFSTARSIVNKQESINKLSVACFSYVSHNNEQVGTPKKIPPKVHIKLKDDPKHNPAQNKTAHNLGPPPPRSPPKLQVSSVDDPNDDLYNKTKDTTDTVTEKAKRGTKGVVETAFKAGAAVAEGMEKTWGGVKETTEKLKDSVLGDDDDENNEKHYGGNMRGGGKGYVDKHVEDLRRKAGGYDRRSYH